MVKSLTDIKEKLLSANLKATHQRLVIYEALLQEMTHPTVEYLFDKVKVNNPTISLGTVHKTLDTLVDAGLVKRVSSTDQTKRFDANLEKHNHIYLENSKEIVDYHDEELQQMVMDYLAKKNFKNIKIKEVQLQINADKLDADSAIEIK
jgi:Fur family peroxide stress response transcriptional regulator